MIALGKDSLPKSKISQLFIYVICILPRSGCLQPSMVDTANIIPRSELIHLKVPAQHQSEAGPSISRSAISLGICHSKPRPCPGTPCQSQRKNPLSATGNWDELFGTMD